MKWLKIYKVIAKPRVFSNFNTANKHQWDMSIFPQLSQSRVSNMPYLSH